MINDNSCLSASIATGSEYPDPNFTILPVPSLFLYPYGPYIGFPSYAHPIISEAPNLSSRKSVLYPHIVYFNLFLPSIKRFLPNFLLLSIVKDLTIGFKNSLEPNDFTRIDDEVEYPIPELLILTSTILPFSITGLNFAPLPSPVGSITIKSGFV